MSQIIIAHCKINYYIPPNLLNIDWTNKKGQMIMSVLGALIKNLNLKSFFLKIM
jgi:hypothetical protein